MSASESFYDLASSRCLAAMALSDGVSGCSTGGMDCEDECETNVRRLGTFSPTCFVLGAIPDWTLPRHLHLKPNGFIMTPSSC